MCLSQILHPKGRGEVTLKSADPYDPPVIDPKYYSHPDDLDIVVAGTLYSREKTGLKFSFQTIFYLKINCTSLICLLTGFYFSPLIN